MKSFSFFWKLGGGFIIFTIIYIRFIRSRATGPIDLTYTEVKFYLYIWLIFIFLLALVGIVMFPVYLRYLARHRNDIIEPKNTLFLRIKNFIYKILAFISNTYIRMIEAFYLPLLQKHLEKHSRIWYKITKFIYFFPLYLVFRFFYFLPPAIISLIYLIELTFYHNFTYFPYAIFLMIFPIGIRVLLYNIRQYILLMEKSSEEILVITPKGDDLIYSFSDNFPKERQTEEHIIQLILLKKEVSDFDVVFTHVRNFLILSSEKKYFQIFSLLCWLTSFSIRLYIIFVLINNF